LQLFVDNSGMFTNINVPGGLSPIYPYGPLEAGVNDAGQIVSTTIAQGSGPHAFLYSNDQFSLIPPGSGPATSTYAGGINNAGQIAITISSVGSGSYVYSNGNLTRIPVPPRR
jgi:probable HAF family extracellular repeat protein